MDAMAKVDHLRAHAAGMGDHAQHRDDVADYLQQNETAAAVLNQVGQDAALDALRSEERRERK